MKKLILSIALLAGIAQAGIIANTTAEIQAVIDGGITAVAANNSFVGADKSIMDQGTNSIDIQSVRDAADLSHLGTVTNETFPILSQYDTFDGGLLENQTNFSVQGDSAVAIGERNYVYPNQDGPVGPEPWPHPDAKYWEWPAEWNAVIGFQNWTAGKGTSIIGNNNILERYWSTCVGNHNHLYDFGDGAFGSWNILKGGECFAVGFQNNTYGWQNHVYGLNNYVHGWNNFAFGSGNIVRDADGLSDPVYQQPSGLHNQFTHVFGKDNDTKGDDNNVVGHGNLVIGNTNFVGGIDNVVTATNAFVFGIGITNNYSSSAEFGPNNLNKIAIREEGRFIFPGMNAPDAPTTNNLPVGHFSFWYDADGGPANRGELYIYVNDGGTNKKTQVGGEFTDA